MLWYEQSWPDLKSMPSTTPVVVPLGACEQHGLHLPLYVDTIQVTAIAERVEKALGDQVLLLPTMWLGSSHHHMDFPGTVSVTPSLYSEMIKSIATSVLRAGFNRILFLNGHGGNETPGGQALGELVAENDDADNAYLALSSWWSIGKDAMSQIEDDMSQPFISHACEYETSLMLVLRPDLVHMDRAAQSPPVLDSPWFNFEYGGKVNVYRRYHRLTAQGSMSSPSAATADKGQTLLDSVTHDIVLFLRDFRTWPDLPPIGPAEPDTQ